VPDEQLQPLARRQPVLIAVVRDRNAGDIFHHKVRSALHRRSRIEDFGDRRVVHERQRLPFRFETRHHFPRIHTGLDQLNGDTTANRMFLLRQPDLTHSALADWLKHSVGTDHRSVVRLARFYPARWVFGARIALVALTSLRRHLARVSLRDEMCSV
jgi:hypothetical protein